MSDVTNEDPKNTTSYRLARAAVILLGVLLIIAFVALVVGLAMRMSGHGPNAAMAPASTSFTLPAGAEIVSVEAEPGRVVLHARTPAGDEVDIFDTENGRLVAQIKASRRRVP